MNKALFIITILLVLFVAGCEAAPVAEDRPIVEPSLRQEDALGQASPTNIPATEQTQPATPTPPPTRSAEPSPTEISMTPTPIVPPTPTVPPAPHIDVGQAPYAASDCSDKYPCNDDVDGWESRLQVPSGFEAVYFARMDDQPTSITMGPDGLLYVAGRSGTIYSIDEKGRIEELATGLLVPTGIAFQPGTTKLFVSSRLTDANVNGEGQVSVIEDGKIRQLIDRLPCCYLGMHGPNGIAFGPDGYGYVGVGGRADHGEILVEPSVGEQDELWPVEASVLRFSPDGQDVTVYARGFRNPYDIAWDGDGNLYATDNGRDPDPATGESPPDEVHLVEPGGEHGYPYYDCSVCFGIPDDIKIIPPLLGLIPHAAVTGITAYMHDALPAYYNDLFIVLWSAFEGAQKVVRYSPDSGESSNFATGFAQPIDVTVGPDGELYVADYATGIIFEISPVGQS